MPDRLIPCEGGSATAAMTIVRAFLMVLLPLGALAGAVQGAHGETEDDAWMRDYTALTMAPDGAWGTATARYPNEAIAGAIARCRAMSTSKSGCGAYLAMVRAGWSFALRCGEHVILVAERARDDAERIATRREDELRANYAPGMPSCRRIVTVGPDGRVIEPKTDGVSVSKR
jgi:hypothetical protein